MLQEKIAHCGRSLKSFDLCRAARLHAKRGLSNRRSRLSLQGDSRYEKRKFQDGAPDWIRTSDLQLRRLPLYPSELRARRIDSTRISRIVATLVGREPGKGLIRHRLPGLVTVSITVTIGDGSRSAVLVASQGSLRPRGGGAPAACGFPCRGQRPLHCSRSTRLRGLGRSCGLAGRGLSCRGEESESRPIARLWGRNDPPSLGRLSVTAAITPRRKSGPGDS